MKLVRRVMTAQVRSDFPCDADVQIRGHCDFSIHSRVAERYHAGRFQRTADTSVSIAVIGCCVGFSFLDVRSSSASPFEAPSRIVRRRCMQQELEDGEGSSVGSGRWDERGLGNAECGVRPQDLGPVSVWSRAGASVLGTS